MLYINWQLTLFILVLIPPLMARASSFGGGWNGLDHPGAGSPGRRQRCSMKRSGIRAIKSFGKGVRATAFC